jgi:hypothetical protein
MYLLYLDDSGSAGNPTERFFVLAGVCVFYRQVHWIGKQADDLAAELHPSGAADLEFHSTKIYSGKGFWRSQTKQRRSELIDRLVEVVVNSHASTCLFAAAIDKRAAAPRDPVELAFELLCQRFDRFLRGIYLETGKGERGLIVMDKSTWETKLQTLARDFRTIGHSWGVLRNLVEVPLFVDSRATRLVQLADLVAHLVWRRYERDELDRMRRLLPRFAHEGGVRYGLVHHRLPDEECRCPACYSYEP